MAAVADFDTVALLLADTTMGYSSGTIVSAGDIVTAQGFRYEVAADNATDHHIETDGGVKLYVIPAQAFVTPDVLGIPSSGNDAADRMAQADVIEKADRIAVALGASLLLTRRYEVGRGVHLTGSADIVGRGHTAGVHLIAADSARYNDTTIMTIGGIDDAGAPFNDTRNRRTYSGFSATQAVLSDWENEASCAVEFINIADAKIDLNATLNATVGTKGHARRGDSGVGRFVYNRGMRIKEARDHKHAFLAVNSGGMGGSNVAWANECSLDIQRAWCSSGTHPTKPRYGVTIRSDSPTPYYNNSWTISGSYELGAVGVTGTILNVEHGTAIVLENYRNESNLQVARSLNDSRSIYLYSAYTQVTRLEELGRYAGIYVMRDTQQVHGGTARAPGGSWVSRPASDAYQYAAGQVAWPGLAFSSGSGTAVALGSGNALLRPDHLELTSGYVTFTLDTKSLKRFFVFCDIDGSDAPRLALRCWGERDRRTVLMGPTTIRAASTAYTPGQRAAVPGSSATNIGMFLECIEAGTTDGGAITWPTNIGDTVVDGTVTWMMVPEYVRGLAINSMNAKNTGFGGIYRGGSNSASTTFCVVHSDVQCVDVIAQAQGNSFRLRSFGVISAEVNEPVSVRSPPGYRDDTKYVTVAPADFGFARLGERFDVLEPGSGYAASYIATTGGWLSSMAWQASTVYALNAIVYNGSNTYQCVTTGTSAGSGGPTGTGLAIADGGVVWRYIAPRAAVATLFNMA